MAGNWQEISTAKRSALFNSIPQKWRIPIDITPRDDQLDVSNFAAESGFFTQHELDITSKTAAELLQKLSQAEWTSEEVALAFCKRAAVAQQLLNCLSEAFFEEAIADARALDAHLKRSGKPKGPLHGLPISLKDNFYVAGTDSTLGFTSLANDPAVQESTLVEMLRAAGAVLYCKTNVPTAMMIAETVNNLTGRTLNPLNRSLTPGGSSGGEAALVAFMGSPLGIGSDIGRFKGPLCLRFQVFSTGYFAD
jgi:amidase